MATYRYITQSSLQRALLEARSYVGLNANAYRFPRWRVAAWNTDGSATLADSTNPQYQRIIGVSYEDIASGSSGLFVRSGVIEGALTGLEAAAGDTIYLGLVPGTFTKVLPTDPAQTVIQIGYAENSGTAGAANNLRVDIEVIESTEEPTDTTSEQNSLSYRNGTDSPIPKYRAVAWSGQTISPGDAGSASLSSIVGVTTATIQVESYGPVQHSGIIQGAITGLLASPGAPVFLSEGGDGALVLTPPSGLENAVVRIGYAVPRTGTSSAATDLLLAIERLLMP